MAAGCSRVASKAARLQRACERHPERIVMRNRVVGEMQGKSTDGRVGINGVIRTFLQRLSAPKSPQKRLDCSGTRNVAHASR